ncbi:hypothetical protein [Streptomyces sclerotialus]|uniref:hypothetical protein n=1 Tax=Streptomyces sclerotialus TaxID=1957 RepID=UPI0004C6BFFE
MRTKRILATAATLLSLTTLAACGSDSDPGNKGGDASAGKNGGAQGKADSGNDPGKDLGLTKVSSMDALVQLVATATQCQDVDQGPDSTHIQFIDGDSTGDPAAALAKSNKAWSIKDRAVCYGESYADDIHRLILIDDMTRFQAAYKARQEADVRAGKGNSTARYLVGQNFAVKLNASDRDKQALVELGTLELNCLPNFTPPNGARNEKALVKGCTLTDYVD